MDHRFKKKEKKKEAEGPDSGGLWGERKIKMGAYPMPKQIILQFKSDFPDPQRQLLLTVNIIKHTTCQAVMEYWLYSVICHSNIMKWVFSSPSYKHRDRTWEVKELARCETTDKCWSHAS